MNESSVKSAVTSPLALTTAPPFAQQPAAVYLSGLASASRPTMRQALNASASMLTKGECDADTLDWAKLRYQHTAAVRAGLKKRYAPTTTNKMLCALRRVLKVVHRLDLMDAQDYTKAVDLPSIRETKNITVALLSQMKLPL